MPEIMGTAPNLYESVEEWAKLPTGWEIYEVSAVGVDRKDNVYVFSRGDHPMIVFDKEGNFLRSWGDGMFVRPHGIHMGADDTIYCTDDYDHTVRKCTLDGKVLLTLGVSKSPMPHMSGLPFHRCTHTANSPEGEIYVSDGYGNARIHKYSADGKLLLSWGAPGIGPGEFNFPHNIACDGDGWVYVADRENHRVQVFDSNGKYETEWRSLHRPSSICIHCLADKPVCYVGEGGPVLGMNRATPNLGPRISLVDLNGELITRVGTRRAGSGPGQFIAPHGLAVDSEGSIYVGEVSRTAWPQLYPDEPVPDPVRTLQKLARVGSGSTPS